MIFSNETKRVLAVLLSLTFSLNISSAQCASLAAPTQGVMQKGIYDLPRPGTLLPPSLAFSAPLLKGMKIDKHNPFKMEFIIDTRDQGNVDKAEINRLISYFFAAITIPEKDLWVNLSPYEQNRVMPQELSYTQMGKDLLGEDYILKQLASSLTYPESDSGKQYWNTIQGAGGSRTVSTNNFNKVWIVPAYAHVYESGNVAIVSECRLKVMMNEDYLAMQNNGVGANNHSPATQSFRANILPLIEKEVNSGKNFATLRQVYNSFLLAAWFKNKVKDSVYKYYIDQKKITGIDLKDKSAKEKVFNLYVEAFKTGVYNYVKRERVLSGGMGQKITKRAYFSGGTVVTNAATETTPEPSDGLAARITSSDVHVGGEVVDPSDQAPIARSAKLAAPSRTLTKAQITLLAQQIMDMDGEKARAWVTRRISKFSSSQLNAMVEGPVTQVMGDTAEDLKDRQRRLEFATSDTIFRSSEYEKSYQGDIEHLDHLIGALRIIREVCETRSADGRKSGVARAANNAAPSSTLTQAQVKRLVSDMRKRTDAIAEGKEHFSGSPSMAGDGYSRYADKEEAAMVQELAAKLSADQLTEISDDLRAARRKTEDDLRGARDPDNLSFDEEPGFRRDTINRLELEHHSLGILESVVGKAWSAKDRTQRVARAAKIADPSRTLLTEDQIEALADGLRGMKDEAAESKVAGQLTRFLADDFSAMAKGPINRMIDDASAKLQELQALQRSAQGANDYTQQIKDLFERISRLRIVMGVLYEHSNEGLAVYGLTKAPQSPFADKIAGKDQPAAVSGEVMNGWRAQLKQEGEYTLDADGVKITDVDNMPKDRRAERLFEDEENRTGRSIVIDKNTTGKLRGEVIAHEKYEFKRETSLLAKMDKPYHALSGIEKDALQIKVHRLAETDMILDQWQPGQPLLLRHQASLEGYTPFDVLGFVGVNRDEHHALYNEHYTPAQVAKLLAYEKAFQAEANRLGGVVLTTQTLEMETTGSLKFENLPLDVVQDFSKIAGVAFKVNFFKKGVDIHSFLQ